MRKLTRTTGTGVELQRRVVVSSTGTYLKVTQKLVSNATTVVFDDIDQTFTTLRLEWTAAAVDNTQEQIVMATFNDANSDGDYHWHINSPGGVGDTIDLTSALCVSAYAGLGFMSCDSNSGGGGYDNYFSTGVVAFPDYTDDVATSIGYSGNGAAGIAQSVDTDVWLSGGYRTATGPLTKITLYSFESTSLPPGGSADFKAGSRFTLLGF